MQKQMLLRRFGVAFFDLSLWINERIRMEKKINNIFRVCPKNLEKADDTGLARM